MAKPYIHFIEPNRSSICKQKGVHYGRFLSELGYIPTLERDVLKDIMTSGEYSWSGICPECLYQAVLLLEPTW